MSPTLASLSFKLTPVIEPGPNSKSAANDFAFLAFLSTTVLEVSGFFGGKSSAGGFSVGSVGVEWKSLCNDVDKFGDAFPSEDLDFVVV